jgi:hypothetical protein
MCSGHIDKYEPKYIYHVKKLQLPAKLIKSNIVKKAQATFESIVILLCVLNIPGGTNFAAAFGGLCLLLCV